HLLDRDRLSDPPFTELPVMPSEYPPGAAGRKEQGLVTLIATVLPNGSVAKIEMKDSSGYPDLDDSAMKIAKARFRPKSADFGGRTEPAELGIIVVWTLP